MAPEHNSILSTQTFGNLEHDRLLQGFQLLTGMNSLLVCVEISTLCETFSTNLTQVRFLTCVSPHMHLQAGCSVALILTHIAFEWSFAGVNTHVCPQITSLSTLIPTHLTYEWKLLRMCQHVRGQVARVVETSSAFSTLVRFFFCVNSKMSC